MFATNEKHDEDSGPQGNGALLGTVDIVEVDAAASALGLRIRELERRLAREVHRRRALEESRAYRLATRAVETAEIPLRGLGFLARGSRTAIGAALGLMPERLEVSGKLFLGRLFKWEEEAWIVVPSLVPALEKDSGRIPTLLFLAMGLTEEDIKSLIAGLASMREQGRRIRPVIVTDSDRFHLLREQGLLFEFIPPPEDFRGRFPSIDYEKYLENRLAQILRAYNPDRLLGVGQSVAKSVMTAVTGLRSRR